jgi:hypothetical protein
LFWCLGIVEYGGKGATESVNYGTHGGLCYKEEKLLQFFGWCYSLDRQLNSCTNRQVDSKMDERQCLVGKRSL